MRKVLFVFLGLFWALGFWVEGVEQRIVREHKRFYQAGDVVELNAILDLAAHKGAQVGEVQLAYHMLRSRLEVDWLCNGQVLAHTGLRRGLKRKSSFVYDRAVNDVLAVRLTGTSGRLQMLSITAEIRPGGQAVDPPKTSPAVRPGLNLAGGEKQNVTDLVVHKGKGIAHIPISFPDLKNEALKAFPARKVAIKAWNGRYVCVDENKGGSLVADRTQVGEWETFRMHVMREGRVVLQAWNGEYLAPDPGDGHRLKKRGKELRPLHQFVLTEQGGKRFSLATSEGRIVCADQSKGDALFADRSNIGQWEVFTLENLERQATRGFDFKRERFVAAVTAPFGFDLGQRWLQAKQQLKAHQAKQFRQTMKVKQGGLRVMQPFNARLSPVIRNVFSETHGDQAILTPGAAFLVEGEHFADSAGSIELLLDHKVNNRKKIVMQPGSITWNPRLIFATLSSMPGLVEPVSATLVINRADPTPVPGRFRVTVTPRRVVRQVSGLKYFQPAPNDRQHMQTKEFNDGRMLLVLHDPACGLIGDDGVDTFVFNLPKGCRVEKALFVPQLPSDPELGRRWIENHFKEILAAVARGGIAGLAKYGGKVLLEFVISALSPGAGKYGAWLLSPPTQAPKVVQILWHNTCFATYDDIPVAYVMSVFVSCPEGVNL